MSAALKKTARLEAAARMRMPDHMREDVDLPKLHKTHRLSVEDRFLVVEVGSDAQAGRNIVAIPEVEQTDGNSLRIKKGVRLVELNFKEGGAGEIMLPPEQVITNPRNIGIEASFDQTLVRDRGDEAISL